MCTTPLSWDSICMAKKIAFKDIRNRRTTAPDRTALNRAEMSKLISLIFTDDTIFVFSAQALFALRS